MRIRIRYLWEQVTSGYWFVPAVMTACAAAVAFALPYLDNNLIEPRSMGR